MKFFNTHVKSLVLLVMLVSAFLGNQACAQDNSEIRELGSWNNDKLEQIIQNKPESRTDQIDYLSSQFLGTPYQAHTLTGDINTPEIYTVNLTGMDCFTYIDYIEALRLSSALEEFDDNLKGIRYKNGEVSFQNRNHFFSDWPTRNENLIIDITQDIAGDRAASVDKKLNLKADGSNFLPGIPTVSRNIYYIPSSEVNDHIVNKLETGDYIGMYTDIDGLDVTHTGIVIKNDKGVFLRHASSKKSNYKVVDENLREYIKNVPGIVVYRTK